MIGWILLTIFAFIIGIYFLCGITIVKQYMRVVVFTWGKYTKTLEPGFKFVWPIMQVGREVDIRQLVLDLQKQEVMTEDKVNLKIDGVVFYSIEKPEDMIINVRNVEAQLQAKATSELKEIIGKLTMSDSLAKRADIAKELLEQITKAIADEEHKKNWGIVIRGVQINNIELPQELIRGMSKQAEAKQEKEARATKAQGELDASKRFAEAAIIYRKNPEAMRLRELQTYQEIGTEHNSLMIVVPASMTNSDGKWVLPYGSNLIDKDSKTKNILQKLKK